MSRFSPSDAAVEGFQVLGRHWRAVVGWAGFQLVAIVCLCVLLFVVLLGIVPFAGSREAAGGLGGAAGGLLLGFGGLGIELVILCGLYRLLLRPEEPAFMHLRIGRDEGRVLLSVLLLLVIALPLLIVSALAVAVASRVSAIAAFVAALPAALAAYAVILRFGLTPVIAFAERRISPLEAWRRTRGQTWRLIGMALLLTCLVALLAVVIWVVLFVVSGLTTGFTDFGLSDAETLSAHPGRFLLQAAVELVLTPVFLVIGQTPWVAAYRALSASREATEAA